MAEKRGRKRIISVCAVLVVAAIAAAAALRARPPLVPVVRVVREDLSAKVSSNGKVEPVSPAIARAGFPAFVGKVLATEGQAVRHGQLILTLDAADVRSQLAQARADLIAAQTDLKNVRAGGPPDQIAQLEGDLQAAQLQVAGLDRTGKALQSLLAQHAATQDEVSQNQVALARARANLDALEAKKQMLAQLSASRLEGATLRVGQMQDTVRSLEQKVRSATVIAPASGILYSLPVRAGDYVKVGDVLAEMADLREVRVRVFVDEPDLGLLAPDQPVEVTWDAKPDRVWTGRTGQTPKQVVARGMRSVGEVLCSVNNDRLDLLPNTNVQVQILVAERKGALSVPRATVRESGGQHFVFVFMGQRVYRRDIAVGIASSSRYEVLQGLAAGDLVAEPVEQELRDREKIRPLEAD